MNPNNAGNPAFFGQKVSKPGVNVLTAGSTGLVYQNNYTTTTYYDNKNSRILLGQLPDSSYGMWVSLPGNDVTTATLGQLAFSSSNSFIVALNGNYTFPTVTVAYTATATLSTIVPHDLGLYPVFEAFGLFPAGGDQQALTTTPFLQPLPQNQLLYIGVGALDEGTGVFVNIVADKENLYLEAQYSNLDFDELPVTFPPFTVYYIVYSSAVVS